MDKKQLLLDIGDFLGFCDMSGEEALTSDQVEQLEKYVISCQEAHKDGDSLVPDAIYDRLIEILSHKVPDSPLIGRIWEEQGGTDFDESDDLFLANPMYSIQTVKSLDCQELHDFIKRLPDEPFDAHVSYKENGWGIRVIYKNGKHYKSRTRARASAGRDITPQMEVVLQKQGIQEIPELADFEWCEVRGELLCSFTNFEEAKKYKSDLRSPFTAVSAMVRESASEEEWGLLDFIAYKFLGDDMQFDTKSEEYEYLQEVGFETPDDWVIEDLNRDVLIADLQDIIEDCEEGAEDYEYYTDGLVFEVNSRELAQSLGQGSGNYNNYNIALKVGRWKQDMYSGYVQTIAWMKGKTKLTPVAIVAEEPDVIEFRDASDLMYVTDIKEIENLDDMGVLTASGNMVKRVPLYEPSNMLALDAYRGNIIHFRYGGEAGVVPCYPDGTPLIEGRIQQEFE